MCKKNCNPGCNAVPITSYSIGTYFDAITNYCFSNAQNGCVFKVVFQANIPSQTTIVPVLVTPTGGTITALNLVCCKTGSPIMSDQLVDVHTLCVRFSPIGNVLLVEKAFDRCGNILCLKKSANYGTVETIPMKAAK